MIQKIFFFLFISFFPIEAALNLGLTVTSQTWNGSGDNYYNPFDATEYEQPIQFDLTFDSGNSGDYFVTFSKGLHGSGYTRKTSNGSELIAYQTYRRTGKRNVLKDIPEANRGNVIRGTIRSSNSSPKTVSIYWVTPPKKLRPPGTYTDTIQLNAYKGKVNRTNTHQAGPYPLVLTTIVPAILQLSVLPTGASFDQSSISQTLDFGELQAGTNRALDLKIRSNTGYRISMQSINSSTLKNMDGYSTTVPYMLRLNSTLKDLSSGNSVVVKTKNTKSAYDGDSYTVTVQITSTDGAIPRNYADTIHISLSSI